MIGRYKLITDAADPLEVDDVKHYLNVVCEDDDDMIEGFITAARQMVESKTNYKLGEAVIDFIFDRFYPEMWCEAMAAEITHIKYYDTKGVEQTLDTDDYESSLTEFPAVVRVNTIPATQQRLGAVTIRVKTPEEFPKPLLIAMKHIIGHWYENRQDVVVGHGANTIPETSNTICAVYRLTVMR